MENASLRIKFNPIFQNFTNKNSKCTIEIVPEVCSFQNLDKLEWKMDNGLVEYTIPMTYKIYIKKENDSAEMDNEKTYHSCVDLLHGCSLSHTNLASGDVTRIISDNFILSKITSNIERCDIILTKKDINHSEKTHDEIDEVVYKTESIQTLKMEEINDSHSRADRSNQIDIKHESLLVVKKVSEINNMKNTAIVNKTNEKLDTEENNVKRTATNTKSSKQRLSLTPMLSIDTYETGPFEEDKQEKEGRIFEKTVTEKNIFKEFVQSLSGGGHNCEPVFKVDNNKYFQYIVLDKAGNILQPLSDNSYHQKGRVDKNDSDSTKVHTNQKYQKLKHATLNDIIYKAQDYDGLQAMGVNDFNIIWNPNNNNQSRFIELQNTVVTLQGNDYENDHKIAQKSSYVKAINFHVNSKDKDNFAIDTMSTITPSTNHKDLHRPKNLKLNRLVSDMIISNNDYSKSDCAANRYLSNKLSKWISQNSRVSQFDKYLEKEIYPLVSELNDIRNRCVSYGLFTRDMIPCFNYTTCKSLPSAERENKMITSKILPNFEKEINNNQATKSSYETCMDQQSKVTEYQRRKKSNRMVYSILFNE